MSDNDHVRTVVDNSMQRKLKINDYIRTDKGRIGKVIDIYPEYKDTYDEPVIDYGPNKDTEVDYYNYYDEIVAYSAKPIDLVRVGDYVNGKQVLYVGYKYYKENEDGKLEGVGEKLILVNEFTHEVFINAEIKSIFTKEMFDLTKYEVR